MAKPPATRKWRLPVAVFLGAIVLVVVTFFATRAWWSGPSDDEVTEAQKQYCDFTRDLIAIDFNSWDAYFDKLAGKTSGEAKETVDKNFISQSIKDAVVASQLKRSVVSNDCGVETSTDDRIDLIAFVVAQSTNAQGTFAEQFAITGEMKKVDGDWTITKIALPVLNPY